MAKKTRFSGKNVFITGGSSGIGLEIAMLFAEQGSRLFLAARRRQKLEEAKALIQERFGDTSVKIFPVDVGCRKELEKVLQSIGEEQGGIDVLINNAGISCHGRLEDNTIEELEEVMKVNYLAVLYAIKTAWPYLKKSSSPHIGLVSSVAAYSGGIGYASYTPTKSAMEGLAECLRMEAAEEGIGVTIVYPPDTETPMLEEERKKALPETKALSGSIEPLAAKVVAKAFVNGILKKHFHVFCGFESRLIYFMKGVCPSFYFRILDRIVAKDKRRRKT